MSQNQKQAPSNWGAYERGRSSSVGSLSSITENEVQTEYRGSPSSPTGARMSRGLDRGDGEQQLRPRRSSVFNSIRQMGGINNLDNFARSFQRAAGFWEITPARRGSISYADEDGGETAENTETQGQTPPVKSLLRQQFEAAQRDSPEMAVTDTPTATAHLQPEPSETTSLLSPRRSRNAPGSFSVRSRLNPEAFAGGDLGSSFGSISSRLTSTAQTRATILIQQHLEASIRARELEDDGDEIKDDFVERQVEIETRDDGEVIERVVGESTVPMTVFNSINILIGVGVLALPLALKYTGWIIGTIFLLLPAPLTFYTAKLLAKCLDSNSGSTTYGDLAFLAFGDVGRAAIEALFIVELLGANVALLIIFGDTMHSLIPAVGILTWKAVLAIGLLPLNFAPFKTLSVTSVLGILCTVSVITITITDGFIKPESPGSLRQVIHTRMWPEDFRTVPLSIGLFIAPWGAHSVFPAVYKDMRHPQKYDKALRTAYITTYGLDLTMAVGGYLMFGDLVQNEISTNIITNDAYPKALSVMIVILLAILPITKIPLTNKPIMDTVNKKFRIDLRQMDREARAHSEASLKHRLGRAGIASACNIIQLGVSVLIPEFDSIMATMGASVCLTICAILPIAFYLQIFDANGLEISKKERIFGYVIMAVASLFAVAGTVAAILPKDKLGARACQGLICMG